MASHPWLTPSAALVSEIAHARARALLPTLATIPQQRLGSRAAAWPLLLAALPALLREEPVRLLDAIARIDVFAGLQALARERGDASRIERGLITLWLALAGHPGLASPIVLPGPFRERVVDPKAARLVALGDVRGLGATARGAVVLTRTGRMPIDAFVVSELPSFEGTVIVDSRLDAPEAPVVARIGSALAAAGASLPAGLERVTVAGGDAVFGEARVGPDGDPADLVRSAQAAFVRAAAEVEPVFSPGGVRVDNGTRVHPTEVLACISGDAMALPWRADRAAAPNSIAADVDELRATADPTPHGAALVSALDEVVSSASRPNHRRALLVNIDADDFTYAFQFGRSVERRCVERGLRVDRISIDFSSGRDLAAELGGVVPPPIADGIEVLIQSDADEAASSAALRRFVSRRYEVVVANVRPRLFHDLLAGGFLAAPTLLWDRHLHGGLRAEGDRRGVDSSSLGKLPIEVWSLDKKTGPYLQPSLAEAGLEQGTGRVWPLDLEFFQSTLAQDPDRVFSGGENQRDWPLFLEAVRDLPLDVHVVSRQVPAERPSNVRVEARLPLSRFRDALAAASIFAVPLVADAAAGVTVIPMAMALGVAVVATRTPWTEPLIDDGEDGLLVPPGDAAALRAAIIRLREQPSLRARLVANARRKVAELCDLEAFTREMFATLDN